MIGLWRGALECNRKIEEALLGEPGALCTIVYLSNILRSYTEDPKHNLNKSQQVAIDERT